MGRSVSVFVLTLALVAAAASADAQGRGRANQEPAYARGYADGYRHAQEDREDRRSYDPVTHRDYREADQGFYRSYGSLDAYKNNYRAGFRAGYDAGYREVRRARP